MTIRICTTFMLLLALFASGQQATTSTFAVMPIPRQTGGINWLNASGWNEVLTKAKKENRFIFIDFYTTWCAPCKRMEREVYTDSAVSAMLNEHFICLKIQMDTTDRDNAHIRRWYADAKKLGNLYSVNAFPCLVFLDPSATITSKAIGFMQAPEFLGLCKRGMDPQNVLYAQQLNAYKKGQRNVATDLYQLATFAYELQEQDWAAIIAERYIAQASGDQLLSPGKILFIADVAGKRELADSLAAAYKRNFLDNLSVPEISTKEHIAFIRRYIKLVHSGDNVFRLCYDQPALADSLAEYAGWAGLLVNHVITREELVQKAAPGEDQLHPSPQWTMLEQNIRRKYPQVNAPLLTLDYQLKYYKQLKQYERYASLLVQRVQQYGPFGPIDDVDFNLNNLAWEVFLYSNDSSELNIALTWSDSAVKLCKNNNITNWMDTKANLLYKLGRVEEAIALQTKVVAAKPKKEYADALSKMKKGQPTWKRDEE